MADVENKLVREIEEYLEYKEKEGVKEDDDLLTDNK